MDEERQLKRKEIRQMAFAIVRMLFAATLCGMAAWSLVLRYDGEETTRWLVAISVTLGAIALGLIVAEIVVRMRGLKYKLRRLRAENRAK